MLLCVFGCGVWFCFCLCWFVRFCYWCLIVWLFNSFWFCVVCLLCLFVLLLFVISWRLLVYFNCLCVFNVWLWLLVAFVCLLGNWWWLLNLVYLCFELVLGCCSYVLLFVMFWRFVYCADCCFNCFAVALTWWICAL